MIEIPAAFDLVQKLYAHGALQTSNMVMIKFIVGEPDGGVEGFTAFFIHFSIVAMVTLHFFGTEQRQHHVILPNVFDVYMWVCFMVVGSGMARVSDRKTSLQMPGNNLFSWIFGLHVRYVN